MLQDVASRLGISGDDRFRYGHLINKIPLTKLLWAAGNCFRHRSEWKEFEREYNIGWEKFDDSLANHTNFKDLNANVIDGIMKNLNSQAKSHHKQEISRNRVEKVIKKRLKQLASIRPLQVAIGNQDLGAHPTFSILKEFSNGGIGTYDLLEQAVIAVAKEMADATSAEGAFTKAQKWAERLSEYAPKYSSTDAKP